MRVLRSMKLRPEYYRESRFDVSVEQLLCRQPSIFKTFIPFGIYNRVTTSDNNGIVVVTNFVF